jgi:hypothetical protein
MDVGPVSGDVESSGFSSDQGVFVGLGCGQSACRVQLAEIIFEHAFNIKEVSDTSPRIRRAAAHEQHLINPDNTTTVVTAMGWLACPAPELGSS